MWMLGLALVVAGFCAALITARRSPRTTQHSGVSGLGGADLGPEAGAPLAGTLVGTGAGRGSVGSPSHAALSTALRPGAPRSPSKNMAVAELGKAAAGAPQPAGTATGAAAAGAAKEGKHAPAATHPTAITASSSSMDVPPSLPLSAAMPHPALEAASLASQPGAPTNLPQLQARLAAAFAAERARGVTIGSRQPPESAARLQAAVRQEIQAYLASGCEDWREFVHWNDHHYVRNLVAENEDFELMVRTGLATSFKLVLSELL